MSAITSHSEDNSTTPLQALQSCSESFTRVFSQAHCPNPGLLKRVRLRKSLPGHTPYPVPLAGKWDFSYLIFSTLPNNSALEMRTEQADWLQTDHLWHCHPPWDCGSQGISVRLLRFPLKSLLSQLFMFLALIHLLQGQHKVNSVSF